MSNDPSGIKFEAAGGPGPVYGRGQVCNRGRTQLLQSGNHHADSRFADSSLAERQDEPPPPPWWTDGSLDWFWAACEKAGLLARLPNVAVKLSGAPSCSTQPYPYTNIHGYLRKIIEAFGPERCFWGTDITRMPCTYRQCVTMYTEEMPWLKGRDLEQVMGAAVVNWLGWTRKI